MRGPAPPPESAEMVWEVLLKLPTRDVARCCCVCRLWRSVAAEPTFRSLHAEAVANNVSAASEALMVMEIREHGRPDEASFSIISLSTPKPMPHRITIPGGYSLSNVCNGLLCFALDLAEAPAFICNPVTGETATVPTPVGARLPEGTVYHHYALGFSPSTKEHKLFRFAFSPSNSIAGIKIDQSVCTLGGGGGGWRQRSYTFQCPLCTLPPVLVDGSLFLVTRDRTNGPRWNYDGMLVVDVATEAHRRYRLPIWVDEYRAATDPLVNTFEMSGRLCLVVKTRRRKLEFWVMSLPPPDQWVEGDDDKLWWWDMRYSFFVDDVHHLNIRTGAWLDDGTLFFRHGDVLFKHSTRERPWSPEPVKCDLRLQLPPTPWNCKWNIIGGYRPSLLSPLTLAMPPSSWGGEEERREFQHAMFLALRRHE